MSQQAGIFYPPLTVSCVDVRIGVASSVVVPQEEKLEKLFGQNFQWWQQKMFFYFITLNLARFLKEDAPVHRTVEVDRQVINPIYDWNHFDFLYRNYMFNGLSKYLYSVYARKKRAEELWESLERKYKTQGFLSFFSLLRLSTAFLFELGFQDLNPIYDFFGRCTFILQR